MIDIMLPRTPNICHVRDIRLPSKPNIYHVTADHTVEYSTGRIFDQDNIQDNIRQVSCKSSTGISIFKQIALKSKFDISIGTK